TMTAVMQVGGAVSQVSEGETPVSLRRVPYVANLMSGWQQPEDGDRNIHWTREFSAALRPYATGGVFVSFLGDEGQDRVRAAYGLASYERLVDVKNRYDPTNLFRLNQNIRPAA